MSRIPTSSKAASTRWETAGASPTASPPAAWLNARNAAAPKTSPLMLRSGTFQAGSSWLRSRLNVSTELSIIARRADNPALLPNPLSFSIDFSTGRATETNSGEEFGITPYRDGMGLWEAATGPSAVVFRIDRLNGRFARVDKQVRLDGTCEKVDRKF